MLNMNCIYTIFLFSINIICFVGYSFLVTEKLVIHTSWGSRIHL
ncbi:hypothetical protein NC653_027128 [Populus alba x Populus x berolinensis]|uniref:Uncharacterized protein n=1 Tax=Populus alba x Populus x berolinensis TaxID=444605 RepID=A0AAD6M780_9ROSI|nr:hypothetical protein NC653_027128 [Populus alba x Populus x berolinensis]